MNEIVSNKIKALDSILEYMKSNGQVILTVKETPLYLSIGCSQIEQLRNMIKSLMEESQDLNNIHDDVKITYNTVIEKYKNLRGWE